MTGVASIRSGLEQSYAGNRRAGPGSWVSRSRPHRTARAGGSRSGARAR